MVFPVVGGTQDTGYEISNSVYIDRTNGGRLEKTFSGSATDRQKNTVSFWIKRGRLTTGSGTGHQVIFSNQDNDQIGFDGSTDQLRFVSAGTLKVRTNRVFRDVSAWYHIVFAMDTTQGTGSNRIKFYVNGVQETSFETYTVVSENTNHSFFMNQDHDIGRSHSDANRHYDGYIAEFHGVDGQQLDASYFGETNDNGVWIPKKYTGTYGDNGFFLEFNQTGTSADASGKGADTSGNGHHFDDNTMDVEDIRTDTPTKNFATWNPLAERPGDGFITAREGNVKATGASKHAFPTIAFPTSGKWYVEVKFTAGSSTAHLGLRDADDYSADGNTNRLYYRNDGDKDDGGTTSSYGDSWTNSIISIAVNLDDNEVTFYKDGTAQNSGTALSHDASNQYLSAGTAGSYTVEGNFGNPSFSISSGNSDANGYGNFEYAVPSGYYALCTKNLATYG